MMTQLQRDAIKRAQTGDWLLADAMELLAEGRQEHKGAILLGGVRGRSRLRLLVYGEYEACCHCNGKETLACEECDGLGDFACLTCEETGKVVCPFCEQAILGGEEVDCAVCSNKRRIECTDCKGTGRVDCDDCSDGRVECDACDGSGNGDADIEYVLDLNGKVIYSRKGDEDSDGCTEWVDFTSARAELILHEYHHPVSAATSARQPVAVLGPPIPGGTQNAIHYGDIAA